MFEVGKALVTLQNLKENLNFAEERRKKWKWYLTLRHLRKPLEYTKILNCF